MRRARNGVPWYPRCLLGQVLSSTRSLKEAFHSAVGSANAAIRLFVSATSHIKVSKEFPARCLSVNLLCSFGEQVISLGELGMSKTNRDLRPRD